MGIIFQSKIKPNSEFHLKFKGQGHLMLNNNFNRYLKGFLKLVNLTRLNYTFI